MAKVRRWAVGKLQKAQEDRDAAYQKVAKGAGTRLKPGYCLTSLCEPSRKPLRRRAADGQSMAEGARQMAKVRRCAAGKLQKAREDRGRRNTLKGRLLPIGAFWT